MILKTENNYFYIYIFTLMIQIITVAALFGLAGNAYGAAAGYCDGRLAASTEWCMLNERIP